ncbi:hypothetical protein F4775DRAFT_565243 [Biscogniauxia sp. FL1348]|nr:hypothetical protein F4775DRAFT_565243 [Biscogniauxia sp. FL1348]
MVFGLVLFSFFVLGFYMIGWSICGTLASSNNFQLLFFYSLHTTRYIQWMHGWTMACAIKQNKPEYGLLYRSVIRF